MLEEEELAENATRMGHILQEELSTLDQNMVAASRGRGLLQAIVIKESNGKAKVN